MPVVHEGSARDRAGRYNGNGGYTPDGMRYVWPAEGVTRANPGGFGYVGVQDTADWFCCEDVYLNYSLDGRGDTSTSVGRVAAPRPSWTGAGEDERFAGSHFDAVPRGFTITASRSTSSALPRATNSRTSSSTSATRLAAGSGLEGKNGVPGIRDWSCGFDIPDAGDVERMTVRDCQAIDCLQDGFHLDGSWNSHRQIAKDVLFERCVAINCSRRSGIVPAELCQSGFCVLSAKLVDCRTVHCRKAGYLCKNQGGGGLTLDGCSDEGSASSLVIEYGGERVHQMVGNNAEVDIEIRQLRRYRPGRTARLD